MKYPGNCEKGFTLVEILVAVAILLLIAVTFGALFTGSFRGIVSSGNRSETLFELQKSAESDLGAAVIGGEPIEIIFGNNVSITGRQGAFGMETSGGSEVVINVFIPD